MYLLDCDPLGVVARREPHGSRTERHRMLSLTELEEKRIEAYARQGWSADGSHIPADCREEEVARNFAAGVEAGILYAMGHASDPFADAP